MSGGSVESDSHAVRTEKRDVEPRSIVRTGVLLVAVTVGAMLVLLPLLRVLESQRAAQESQPRSLAFDEPRQAPAPRLQEQPTLDVEALRAEESRILESYGWVDREQGVVRLKIERAMELVAERGLPPPAPAPAAEPAP